MKQTVFIYHVQFGFVAKVIRTQPWQQPPKRETALKFIYLTYKSYGKQ